MDGARKSRISRVSGASTSDYGLAGDTRLLTQQRPPFLNPQQEQAQGRGETAPELLQRPPKPQRPDGDGDGSPPPHLSAATSATVSTPTSSATGSSEAGQPAQSSSVSQPPNTADFAASDTGGSSDDFVRSIPTDSHPSNPLNYPPYNFEPQPRELAPPDQETAEQAQRYNASISFSSAVKLLVSNNVAGSIIGRSGQTISDLQTQSSTRIKLSQSGDFYPTTQDRVCLVQGLGENVKRAMSLLLTRLYALQQQQHIQHFAWQRQQQERTMLHDPVYGAIHDPTGGHPSLLPAFSFVVRLLVPAPCCGMIIGKGGTNIKQMVDTSGVSSVRLSPKEHAGASVGSFHPTTTANLVSATSERIVTITGPDLNSCLKCIFVILDGMTANPEISRYTNMTTSYSRVISAQTTMTGAPPPVEVRGSGVGPSPQSQPNIDPYFAGHTLQRDNFAIENQFLGRQSPHPSPSSLNFSQTTALRGTDLPSLAPPFFPPEQTFKQTLQREPLQPTPPNPMYPVPSGFPTHHPPPQHSDPSTHPSGSVSTPDLLALQIQETLRVSEPALMDPSSTQQFVPQMPQHSSSTPGFQAQVAIPDSLIGSILGRGGRTLNELQMHSKTRIRISQKGDFVPGTKNRVVTIRGLTAQSVTTAQYLMSQRMVLPPTAYLHQQANRIDTHTGGAHVQQEPRPQPQPPPSSSSPQYSDTGKKSSSGSSES